MIQIVVFASLIALAVSKPIYSDYYAPSYYSPHAAPAVSSISSNVYRTHGNLGSVSTYEKSLNTPHSSVYKSDVRVTSPSVYAAAYHAPAVYHAPEVYHAPAAAITEVHHPPAVYHAPAEVYHAPAALTEVHHAPVYHAPAEVYHAPAVAAYHAPITAYHAPAAVSYSPATAVSHVSYDFGDLHLAY